MEVNERIKDVRILRDLALRQAEFSNSEHNKNLIKLWLDHNMGRGERPMLTVETNTFAEELLPQRMQCQTEIGRKIEYDFLLRQINCFEFKDDTVLPDYFPVRHQFVFKPFGLDVKLTKTEGLGHHFDPQIIDLQNDEKLLKKSVFYCDDESLEEYKRFAEDAFGDILPVKTEGTCLWCVLTQDLVHLMGMENMFYSMYDYPELFQSVLDRLSDDYIAFHDYLSKNKFILPTNSYEHVSQGTYAFNDVLPKEREIFTPSDVWGFMDSQESVGVSEDMFKELIFPFYEKVGKRFGMLSYGCCEPVDPVWDSCISKFKNLRKVSVSPWCNEKFMGERLAGGQIIYHRKPDPTILGVGKTLDENRLRKHIRTTVEAAEGCKIEFTQRDVYSVNSDVAKVKRYVQILREETEDAY